MPAFVLIVFCLLSSSYVAGAEPGYVDPAACRKCHQPIYDAYQKTGMARSFSRVRNVPGLQQFTHDSSHQQFSILASGSALFMRRASPPLQRRIDYSIGSGNHSTTYAHRDERGILTELPVSWYSENGGAWFMSPGYDRPDHSGFRRRVTSSCLFCHNAYPSEANGGLGDGIDCQRCHGPGEAHVARGGAIVNPAKLSSERRFDVCLQCHLESASRTLPESIRRFGRSEFSYRPGEPLGNFQLYFEYLNAPSDDRITVNGSACGLMKSQCFIRSNGALQCTSCHDPHRQIDAAQAEARFTQVCRSCHASVHEPDRNNCVGCHMQKRRTEDAVHVVMTDHRIRRRPLAGDQVAAIPERHDHLSGPVKLLYPASLPDTAESAVYLSIAGKSVTALESALAKSTGLPFADPWIALAEMLRHAGKSDRALSSFQRAQQLAPEDERSYIGSAQLLMAQDRVDAAVALLRSGLDRMPESTALLNAAAIAYVRKQQFKTALPLVSKAVSVDSNDPLSWLNLGVCLEANGDRDGAINAYRRSYVLDPASNQAKEYLQRLTANK